jgi:NNP family nitrate/nitrite transporter-like MFS transporter
VGQFVVLIPLLWAWLGAESLSQIMTLGLLLGVAGGSFAVALPLASRWYPPQHQGLAMGIAGAGNSGTVLTALFAPRLAEGVGWHGAFGLALIPVVTTLVLFSIFAKESPSQPAPKPLRAYFDLWRERDTLWFRLFYCFTFGGFVGLASFLVILFHDQYGLSKVTSGNLTALCVFAGSFLRPIGGYLADRFGGIRMLSILFAAAASALAAVGLLPPVGIAVALLVLSMGFLGMGNGSIFRLVPQRFRKEIGVATGVVGAAGVACFALLRLLRDRWIESLPPTSAPAPAVAAEGATR